MGGEESVEDFEAVGERGLVEGSVEAEFAEAVVGGGAGGEAGENGEVPGFRRAEAGEGPCDADTEE